MNVQNMNGQNLNYHDMNYHEKCQGEKQRLSAPQSVDRRTRCEATWSATRLKTFATCPRQYKYAYVDRIPSIPTAPLVFGRTLHETLCYMHEYQMRTRRLPKLPDVLLHFYGLWGAAMTNEQPYFSDRAPSAQRYQATGREILRAYLADIENEVPPIAAELAFQIQIGAASNPYTLTGIVDRVEQGEDGLVVVDFESGTRKPKADDVLKDIQLTIYALAMEQMLGQKVERMVYYHLRDGSCLSVEPSRSEFRRLAEEVLPEVSEAVARQQFAPRAGYWCSFCDYRELCRAENRLRWEEALSPSNIVLNDHSSGGNSSTGKASDDEVSDGDIPEVI